MPEPVAAGDGPRDVLERHDAAHADELFLVDSGNRRPDRRYQRFRASGRRCHDEKHIVREILRHWDVDLNEVLGLVRAPLDLPRDADDFAHIGRGLRRGGGPQRDPLANRRPSAKAARERFVDDADRHAVARIARVEAPSLQDGQVERDEV